MRISSEKLEKVVTVNFEKPHRRWGTTFPDKMQGSVDPRLQQVRVLPAPETLEFKAFHNSEEFPEFSRDVPEIFLGNAEAIPGTATAFLSYSSEFSTRNETKFFSK